MKIIIKIIFLFVCSISFAQFDSSYQAILDEATTQGYTLPNSADQTLQNQIIVSAKTSGIWASSDLILYFKGSGDKNFKLINWKNPTGVKATEEAYGGALTWSSTGVKGDGLAVINTHFDLTSGGLNYVQNNAGAYIKISQAYTTKYNLFGGNNVELSTAFQRPSINSDGSLPPVFTFPVTGLLGVSRNNATSYIASVGSVLTTLTQSSGSVTNQEFKVLGYGNATAIGSRFDGEVAYVIIGGDMTDKLSDMETAFDSTSSGDTQAPTASTLSSTSQTDTSVALSWTAATDDTAVTGYKVYKNGVLEATLGSDLLYQTTGLTAATAYNFTVTALDAAGNESVASNIIAITTNNAITGNLLDTSTWTVGSGSVTGFTRTGTDAENIREMGVGPHGTSEILWKGITDGTIVNDDGGWTTDIAIDPSKTYRCTVWMKKTNSNDGHTSFGVRAKDVSGNWALSSLDNTTQTYATYYNGPIPVLNNWYLLVGYVHNSSFSSTTSAGGLYDGLTGAKVVDLVDKKFQSTASKLINKPMLHRGTPNTADALYFYAPTIYEVNGQEPTIQELIDGPSDTQAPTASTISSSGQSDTTVDLSWTAATDNTAVTGYKVYKGGVLETTLGNVLTYQVTGLTVATAYNFTVRAIDAAGNESVDSNTLAITTNTASNFYTLQHIRASDETVMGTILDGYTLTVSDATTFNINAIPSSSVGSTEFALTGAITHNKIESSLPHALYGDQGFSDFSNGPDLSIGSYTLTVTAWSSSGGSGSQIAQDVVNFTVITSGSDIQAPTATTLSSTGQSDTTVDLSWTAATDNTAVTGYKVYKGGVLETTLGNVLTYQVTGLTAATAYNFTVRAIDAVDNESVDSNTLAITTNAASGGGSGNWSLNNQNVYYNAGNVGIGTTTPDEKLAVNGNIHAKEVRVDLNNWPDYVFTKAHDLPSLKEVESYIKTKGHLPNIPSAKEVEEEGIQLGEMNAKLLEKIEELTLYVLQLKKELEVQKEQIKSLGKN